VGDGQRDGAVNPAWPERARLQVAVLAALTIAVAALGCRIVFADPAHDREPLEFVLYLMAAAALCVVGLARHRHPSVVWLGCIAAATFGFLDLVAAVRTNAVVVDASSVPWLMAAIALSGIGCVVIAAAYATGRTRRLGRWVVAVAWLGIAIAPIVAISIAANAVAENFTNSIGGLTRVALAIVLVLTVLGILGDLRPAMRRSSLRLEAETADGHPPPRGRRLAILFDELAPGRTRADRAAADERTRIAADLHAHVVPPVQRALQEAEQGGSPERLVATLRAVLEDVDALVEDRHSVTLDALGLVPALEQLAERIEERSDVRISIEVEAALGSSAAVRPPLAVERAALRIAHLALDNVARHAPTAAIRVDVLADQAVVRLVVADDGPGLPGDLGAAAVVAGRRGLADMRLAAETCGGSLVATTGTGGGATITFAWPAEPAVNPVSEGISRKRQGGASAIST
jgi:signal transduction histidine kinase